MSRADQTLAEFLDKEHKGQALNPDRDSHHAWLHEFQKQAGDLHEALRHLLDVEFEQCGFLGEVEPDPSGWPRDIIRAGVAMKAMGLVDAIPTNAQPWEQFRYELIRDAANGAQPREIKKSLADAGKSSLLRKGTWQHVFNTLNGLPGRMQRAEESKRFPRLFPPIPASKTRSVSRDPRFADDNDQFVLLRNACTDLELQGKEFKLIDSICKSEGGVKMADLILMMGWTIDNADSRWSAMRCRLNRKLKKFRWKLFRFRNSIRAKPIDGTK